MEMNQVKRWSESVECESSYGRKLMISIGFDYTGDLLTGPYGVFMTIEDEDDMVYSNLDEDKPYVRTAERYVAVLMQLGVGEQVLFELFDRAEGYALALEHLRMFELGKMLGDEAAKRRPGKGPGLFDLLK